MKDDRVIPTGGCLIPAIFILILMFLIMGCKKEETPCYRTNPIFPHGMPDTINSDVDGEHYIISFIYNCHYNKKTIYRYESEDFCQDWIETITETDCEIKGSKLKT